MVFMNSKCHIFNFLKHTNISISRRHESDRLREMKEKYRIGDGSVIDSGAPGDTQSNMYNTSQGFYN